MTKTKDPNAPCPKRAGPAIKTNSTTGAFQISDELWEVLAPLIPQRVNTHPFGGGRPRVPDRTGANGIFYVLRTGCQWKALDATGICSGSTAHLRFQEWVAAGVFLELWRVGLERYDELQGLDWSWLSMDGAITKSPLGGGKTGANPTDRGKTGVKRSLLTEAQGISVGLAVDGANRHDMKLVRATVDSVAVPRPASENSSSGTWRPPRRETVHNRGTCFSRHRSRSVVLRGIPATGHVYSKRNRSTIHSAGISRPRNYRPMPTACPL